MRVLISLFVCLYLYHYADGESAPFITPCHASNATCMKNSAQKAIPVVAAGVTSLGIATLDPMFVDSIQANQKGLKLDFRNTTVKGLRKCIVESLKRKEAKTLLELRCSVIMTGDYTLGGMLLIFQIEGNGKYKIKIRDIVVKISYNVTERSVNGEKYWRVHNWKHSADVKTSVQFNFENLFNGNKKLADPIQKFANERWQDIFQEVAPPIVDAIVSRIIHETNKIFDGVPANQLALD